MGNEKISVIIPVFNSMATLRPCLESVVTAIEHYGNAELIVLDNGSSDGSYEWLLRTYGRAARIEQIPGVSISALRNRGAAQAGGEYLSFIDSDCVVPADYFQAAMQVFRSIAADAAGCEYELPSSPTWLEETWHHLHWRPADGYVPYLYSGNLLMHRAVFEGVGGFDEGLLTGEDAELGLKTTRAGYRIYRSHQIPAVHLGNPKNLGAFFRKQVWHSLGMFGSLSISALDKPLLLTFVHVALVLLGIAGLLWAPCGLWLRLAGFLLVTSLAPLATVLHRSVQRGGLYRPFRSLLLYHVYFAARAYALLLLAIGGRAASLRQHRKYGGARAASRPAPSEAETTKGAQE